eukprot:scaffold6053_cov61-Attheya_sp.AAC.2
MDHDSFAASGLVPWQRPLSRTGKEPPSSWIAEPRQETFDAAVLRVVVVAATVFYRSFVSLVSSLSYIPFLATADIEIVWDDFDFYGCCTRSTPKSTNNKP